MTDHAETIRRALDRLCEEIGPGADVLLAADAELRALVAETQRLEAARDELRRLLTTATEPLNPAVPPSNAAAWNLARENTRLRAETQRKDEALRAAAWLAEFGTDAQRQTYECGHGATVWEDCPERCEAHRAMVAVAAALAAARGPEPEPRKLVNPLFPEFGDGLPVPDAGPEPETRCQECGHDPEDGHEFLCETGIAEIRARAARGPEPETKP